MLTKIKKNLTISNGLSLLRIVLIPFIVINYFNGGHKQAILLLFISGVSDFLDGKIARALNQITQLGILLDPIADKLTQLALILCVLKEHPLFYLLLILFLIKESYMAIMGLYFLKWNRRLQGALFAGKLSTFVIYVGMLILFVFPKLQMIYVNLLFIIMLIVLLNSLYSYHKEYQKMRLQVNKASFPNKD